MSKKNQKKLSGSRKKEAKRRRWQKMLDVKMNNKMGRKLVGLFLLVILALVGLAIRITAINMSNGKQYERIVLNQTQQQYESKTIPFKRGDIKDRNGTILATSDKVYNLILDCKVVNSDVTISVKNEATGKSHNETGQFYLDPTVEALVTLFGFDEQTIRDYLTNDPNNQYLILQENMSISDKQKLEDYMDTESLENEYLGIKDEDADAENADAENADAEEKELTDEQKAEIQKRELVQGIYFVEDYLRVYPMDSMACDLIGFSNAENTASYGIEGYYSDVLNGTNGRQFGYFNDDADAEQTIIDPVDGKNVISTIDVNIQQIIRSAIEKFNQKYSNGPQGEDAAENIGVIVMDPDTGEILGMDSSNWYDLNNAQPYTKADFNAMTDEQYEQVKNELRQQWLNFCVSDSFEPGSTFKPITVASALETSSVSSSDTFNCDGFEKINDSTIHCVAYPGEHGVLDLAGALKVSCNDVLMQVGERMGASEFLKYQELFNFGMKTGVDLPEENAGILQDTDDIGDVELATNSFGQGFTCTMIQEAAAFSAVINGGYYYKPHVVSAITDSSGAVTERIDKVVERQVISPSVSDQVREWLGAVVQEGGSGETARVDGYSMGGKTGTAQKVNSETQTYDGNYVVSFIGCAPLEDPEVVVYVVVDTPNVEDQGSSVYAQEIAREIFIELLPYMNIFSDDQAATDAFVAQLREAEAAGQTFTSSSDQTVEEQSTDSQAADGQTTDDQSADGQAVEGQTDESQQVLDTDIPVPPEETSDTADTGGDTLYSEEIPNSE